MHYDQGMKIDNNLSALWAQQEALFQHAQNIAKAFDPPAASADAVPVPDLAESVVGLLNVRRLTEAQIQVLRAQDEMLSEVIDLRA